MFDRFGQNERTGVGGRSHRGPADDETMKEQLLEELSVLRRRHDSLQMRNRSSMLESPSLATPQGMPGEHPSTFLSSAHLVPNSSYGLPVSTPSLYGAGASISIPDEKPVLGQSDKDAIEALFAVDDFAEIFNAGGNVSNLPPPAMHAPASVAQQLAPVCHMCCKKLRPSDIAAYVNPAAFDPSKPTARRTNRAKPK